MRYTYGSFYIGVAPCPHEAIKKYNTNYNRKEFGVLIGIIYDLPFIDAIRIQSKLKGNTCKEYAKQYFREHGRLINQD